MKSSDTNTQFNQGAWVRLLVTLCGLLFAANLAYADGGADHGGNGIFVQRDNSSPLVLFDLYVNDPSFKDTRFGDRVRYQVPNQGQSYTGEFVDYRKFRSFAILRQRLALWQSRAPNLVGLIDFQNFALGKGEPAYEILFVATNLSVEVVDEVFVPDAIAQANPVAYAGAYFDNDRNDVYVTDSIWERAGSISQSAFLLHERMRFLQTEFQLPNEELQRLVYLIIARDPSTVTEAELDDSRFSKSSVLLHPKQDWSVGMLFGKDPLGEFEGNMLKCAEAANPKACAKPLLAKGGTKDPRFWDPVIWLNQGYYIPGLIKKNILSARSPQPIQLMSKGSNNVPVRALSQGKYSAMYGSYDVTDCQSRGTITKWNNLCGFSELILGPTQNLPDILSATLTNRKGTELDMSSLELFGYIPTLTNVSGNEYLLELKGDPQVTPTPPDFNLKLIKN